MRYRNTSTHLEDLTGGRAVDPGEFIELSEEEAKDDYNAAKIAAGVFIEAQEKKSTTKSKEGDS